MNGTTTQPDEIIQEVRTIREELAAYHNYNIRALYNEAKRREHEEGRETVHLEPKPTREMPDKSD